MTILLVLLAITFVLWIVFYNSIVSLKNKRDNAFADIDVQLKNRFDLIPNLISTVQWYADYEKWTLEKVIQARNTYLSAWDNIEDKIKSENQLNAWLRQLFALSESYPDLKANQNFLQLQTELSDLENKIAASRRYFNATTREYNNAILTFPWNLVAKIFWYTKAEYFEISETEKAVPKVEFNFN